MSDKVYTGRLDMVALQAVVDVLRLQARFGIMESLAGIDFPSPDQEAISVINWPKSRIFCPAFELRWEKFEDGYRVVFACADSQSFPEGLHESELTLLSPEEVEYYCWREHDSRLGRTLDYRCVPGKGEVKIVVREYRDDYGRLIFWRYTEMKREEGN